VISIRQIRVRALSPASFLGSNNYVATSQLKGSKHDRRPAQCAETLRTGRAFEKARSMEGRPEGRRSAQNEAGCLGPCLGRSVWAKGSQIRSIPWKYLRLCNGIATQLVLT